MVKTLCCTGGAFPKHPEDLGAQQPPTATLALGRSLPTLQVWLSVLKGPLALREEAFSPAGQTAPCLGCTLTLPDGLEGTPPGTKLDARGKLVKGAQPPKLLMLSVGGFSIALSTGGGSPLFPLGAAGYGALSQTCPCWDSPASSCSSLAKAAAHLAERAPDMSLAGVPGPGFAGERIPPWSETPT